MLNDPIEKRRADAAAKGVKLDPYQGGGATGHKPDINVALEPAANHVVPRGSLRLLTFPELKSLKGICFSVQWTNTLVRQGLFPKPLKLSPGRMGTNHWVESEVDQWLRTRMAARDQEAADGA
jgi:prophage regulatory protein